MNTKNTQRVDIRITEQERRALKNLAEIQGKSMTRVLMDLVKNSAQRQGVWPQVNLRKYRQ